MLAMTATPVTPNSTAAVSSTSSWATTQASSARPTYTPARHAVAKGSTLQTAETTAASE